MSAPSLQGTTAIVTGASNGIGKEAARVLAAMGAEVVLICRNPVLAEQTVAEIRQGTGNTKVEALLADMSSLASIRQVAAQFLASGRPLHILLNNAGAIFPDRCLSVDGYEMTFALNHLGYFLLTKLLLERLRQSAPARIVNVASVSHKSARQGIDFGDLQGERGYNFYGAYAHSKLANILFTRELARRLEGSGVTANCLHPGFVASRFGRANAFYNFIMGLSRPLQRSLSKGARTSVYLCSAPEVAAISGEYFVDCKIARTSKNARDQHVARRLWEISEELVAA